jgi:hypothetical protein
MDILQKLFKEIKGMNHSLVQNDENDEDSLYRKSQNIEEYHFK